MLGSALGQILPQAIGIAISPVPIILLILVLLSARARTSGVVFATGWLLGVLAVTTAAFFLSDSADVATDADAADGGSVIQIILGLLFVGLAVKQWRQRPRPGAEPQTPKLFSAMDTMPAGKVFALAFAAAAANPKNLPLAISSGLALAQTGIATGQGIVGIVIFSLVASCTVLIPVAAVLIFGERTRHVLDGLKSWLLVNNSTVMFVLFTVLAAKMLGSGLALAD